MYKTLTRPHLEYCTQVCVSSVKIWKLKSNTEIRGYEKKKDKNNKRSKMLQLQRGIWEIMINYLTRKENKLWYNWNLWNN